MLLVVIQVVASFHTWNMVGLISANQKPNFLLLNSQLFVGQNSTNLEIPCVFCWDLRHFCLLSNEYKCTGFKIALLSLRHQYEIVKFY